jgi:hypothetical protein
LASGKYLVRVTGEGFATTKIFTMVKWVEKSRVWELG